MADLEKLIAARRKRMLDVIADRRPGETQQQMAKRAGVTQQQISLLLRGDRGVSYNSPRAKARRRVSLGTLYRKDVAYWGQPEVRAVENALQGCKSDAQLAYIIEEVVPVFRAALIARATERRGKAPR